MKPTDTIGFDPKRMDTQHAGGKKLAIRHQELELEARLKRIMLDIFVAVLSCVAVSISKNFKRKAEFLRLYERHKKVCREMAAEYFKYTVFGLYDGSAREALETLKIGLVLYSAFASLYPKKAQKADDGFLYDVKELLEKTCGIREEMKKEADSDSVESLDSLVSYLFPPVSITFVEDERERLITGIILYLIYRKENPCTEKTKAAADRLIMAFIIQDNEEFVIGCKNKKEKGWLGIGRQFCPGLMEMKSMADEFPVLGLDWAEEKEADRSMGIGPYLMYSDIVGMLSRSYGLPDPMDEEFTKGERELALLTIVNSVRNGADQFFADWDFPRQIKFDFDEQKDFVIYFTLTVLSVYRMAEKQKKEQLIFLLEQEESGREVQDERPQSDGTAGEILDVRVKNESLQSRVKELEEKHGKLEEENRMLREKVSRRENRNWDLEDRIKELEKKCAGLRAGREKEKPCPEKEPENGETAAKPEHEKEDAVDKEKIQKEIRQFCSRHKVILVGGNPNMKKKLSKQYPGLRILRMEKVRTCDEAVRNAELVLFRTDSIGHKEYEKIKNLCKKQNIPYEYIEDVTNPEMIDRSLYGLLKKYDGMQNACFGKECR